MFNNKIFTIFARCRSVDLLDGRKKLNEKEKKRLMRHTTIVTNRNMMKREKQQLFSIIPFVLRNHVN